MPEEYKVVSIHISGGGKGTKQIERDLNALGSQGWEVLGVIPGAGGAHAQVLAVAKRMGRDKRDRRKTDRRA